MTELIIILCLAGMFAIAAYGWAEWYREGHEPDDEAHERLMKEIRRHD